MKYIQIRHLLIALALAAVAPFALAAFQSNMTIEQAEAEVKLQRADGATLTQIIQNAQKAPLSANMITAALINAGFDAADVVTAMLRNGAPLQTVVNAALAAGASTAAIRQGALAANVTLAAVQAAIDASGLATSTDYAPPAVALGAAGGGGTCTKISVSPC
jgi:hypothetical protein